MRKIRNWWKKNTSFRVGSFWHSFCNKYTSSCLALCKNSRMLRSMSVNREETLFSEKEQKNLRTDCNTQRFVDKCSINDESGRNDDGTLAILDVIVSRACSYRIQAFFQMLCHILQILHNTYQNVVHERTWKPQKLWFLHCLNFFGYTGFTRSYEATNCE